MNLKLHFASLGFMTNFSFTAQNIIFCDVGIAYKYLGTLKKIVFQFARCDAQFLTNCL